VVGSVIRKTVVVPFRSPALLIVLAASLRARGPWCAAISDAEPQPGGAAPAVGASREVILFLTM
jgi:hypothetical protein